MYDVKNITNSRQVTPYGIFNALQTIQFTESPIGDAEDRPKKYFKESPYFLLTENTVPFHNGETPTANTGATSEYNPDLYLRRDKNLLDVNSPIDSRINLGFSVVKHITNDITLTKEDDAKIIVIDSGPGVITVPTGLGPQFGCAFRGVVSFTGVTVHDERETSTVYPWCGLVEINPDEYCVIGGKS